MKELLIFLIIFAIIFSISVAIFNGRFIHSQIKYSIIGPPPVTPFNDFTSSLPLLILMLFLDIALLILGIKEIMDLFLVC